MVKNEQSMSGAMNEAVDVVTATAAIGDIIDNIAEFGGVINFVNEFLDSTIASSGSKGSLRGSGASAFRGNWDDILNFSREYESTLMSWVENIRSQIGEMQNSDADIAKNMEKVEADLDSSHDKIQGALGKVAAGKKDDAVQ